ncbi:UNVERIFIED_CONTAM: ribosomal protein RPL13A [Hammondia hammondi]|eukprot:XP_008887895.1 ribosomal protein RPL13A [Hammondia hammondi]
MTFKKVVVIDCQGHLLGRLASVVAKELLKGQQIICVRCEDINISGSLHRNRLKYQRFLRLRMNSNPRRGPYHLRAPSRILWRTIRGMLRHKVERGQKALARLQVFEGVPTMVERKKRMVVPSALRIVRLKPKRNFCRLGDLSSQVGWSHGDLVARLEEKRKTRSSAYYQKKKERTKMQAEAKSFAQTTLPKDQVAFLQQYGHA